MDLTKDDEVLDAAVSYFEARAKNTSDNMLKDLYTCALQALTKQVARPRLMEMERDSYLCDDLIKYLGHRAYRSRWYFKYKESASRYLHNPQDVSLFGVLVRDVEPRDRDLRGRAAALAGGCPDATSIELTAIYLPEKCILGIGSRIRLGGEWVIMLVTEETLQKVDNHWAVLAVGTAKRDRGLEVAKAKLVHSATSKQMGLDFKRRPGDAGILDRLSMAYEVAAIEGLEVALHPGPDPESEHLCAQCYSGAWRAFELRSLLPVPEQDEQRIFHILHLSALAYCGDRWSDLRRWMADYEEYLEVPSTTGDEWDRRLLVRIFDCWIRILRKRSWEDLDAVRGIIAGLRDDQSEYEQGFLSAINGSGDRAMAFRLVAIYHWAKATELLAVYLTQGTPSAITEELDKHFESSRKAAALSQDAPLEMIQSWLHIAAKRMVAGSIWWVARSLCE